MYKAMFVDDEYMILQGLQMILPWQELGFEVVHTAKSASEALEYLQEHSVDLLITDIRMPEMNGIDMIRQAQAYGNRFFSIILSGYQEFAFVKQGMALGVRNYLVKPVNKEELRSSVQAIAAELEEQQKLLAEKELYQESSLLLWLNDELNESEYLHLLAQQRVPLAAPFTVLQFNGTAEILQKITTFFQQHDQPLILPGRLDENQVIITAAGPRQQINADLKALAQQLNSTDWQLIMSETINEWENLYKAYEKIKQVQSLQAFYPDLFLQEQTIHVDILERNEELPFLSFNKALTIGDVKTIQHELDKMFAILEQTQADPEHVRYVSFLLRQLTNYVTHLQPEMRINYCKLITVSVDDKTNTNETRDALAAEWPFLMDPDRRLLYELQMVDTTDPPHGEVYVPYSFSLDRDRTIHKIYNGWYFVGRPTVEDIRQDWRALLSRRPDYVYDPSRAPVLKGDAFYDRSG